MNRSKDVAYNLIEDMAKNYHSWGSTCEINVKSSKTCGLYEVNPFVHMNAKVDALYQKIENISISPATHVTHATPAVLYCEIRGINRHITNDCQMI